MMSSHLHPDSDQSNYQSFHCSQRDYATAVMAAWQESATHKSTCRLVNIFDQLMQIPVHSVHMAHVRVMHMPTTDSKVISWPVKETEVLGEDELSLECIVC